MFAAVKIQNLAIAQNLRELRKSHGLTQAELAEFLDTDAIVVSTWERGAAAPNGDNILKLADFFKVPASHFSSAKSEPNRVSEVPTIIDVMEVLDGFKTASKEKRDEVLEILGKKDK